MLKVDEKHKLTDKCYLSVVIRFDKNRERSGRNGEGEVFRQNEKNPE